MAKQKYPDRSGKLNANYRGGFASQCMQCNAPVWVRPSRVLRKGRFCSKACHHQWMSVNVRGAEASAWTGGGVTSKCSQCGAAFVARKGQLSQGKAKFCSSECFGKSRQRQINKTCAVCSVAFSVPLNESKARHCGLACANVSKRKKKTEADKIKIRLDRRMSALVWFELRKKSGKGGRSWKQLVQYTIQQLKAHLEKTLPAGYTWKDYLDGKLEIDHIIPRSAFNYYSPDDYDFARCWALENLQLLTAFDNNSKNAKLSEPFQPTLL